MGLTTSSFARARAKGSLTAKQESKNLLFLKKKKQKDFYSCARGYIRAVATTLGTAE